MTHEDGGIPRGTSLDIQHIPVVMLMLVSQEIHLLPGWLACIDSIGPKVAGYD